MIKKVKALWIVGVLGSIILIACCRGEYLITNIGMIEAVEFEGESLILEDRITGPFRLRIHPTLELLRASATPLISTTMATSCYREHANTIDDISLYLDRNLIYGTDTVQAGSDLSGLIEHSYSADNGWVESYLSFDSTFLSMANFDSANYTYEVVIHTSDMRTFGATKQLFMDID